MAIKMSNNFKNALLTEIKTSLGQSGKYVAIEGYNNSTRVTPAQPEIQGEWDTVSDGELKFKSAVDLPVTQNPINKLIIYGYNAQGGVWQEIAEVELQSGLGETADFSGNVGGGIYRINTFKIKL